MNYKIYNDYEIIYLIKEGNELAYNIMFQKYEKYIWKMVSSFYHYGFKREDIVQEGRMILHTCILGYNSYMDVSFFSYFTICLRRKIAREIKRPYYDEYQILSDNFSLDVYNKQLLCMDSILSKEEEELYEWCFVMDRSLVLYTYKKGISYSEGMKKYRHLLAKVKKIYGL